MSWLKQIFWAFTRKERILFLVASGVSLVSFVVVISIIFSNVTKAVPSVGGEYAEGMIGQPEYINPVIASSQTDLDLVKMLYSNVGDLVDHIDISTDTRTWTIHLKDGLAWQDGQKLTSDDIVFTVESIQDPNAHSPLYASWQGVAVSRVSELEVQFNLVNPYSFFGDNLKNLYIVPKHIFADTPPANWQLSDYNLKPIGSGPYKFASYEKNDSGFISAYHLDGWNGNGAQPLIANFDFQFFTDENTLVSSFNSGQIDGFGGASPEAISEIARPYDIFAWRTSGYYAVFFNESKNLGLQDPAVREALSAAINRGDVINQTLGGNAKPEYGPIPDGAAYYVPPAPATSSLDFASATLTNAGWLVASDTFRYKTINKTPIPLTLNLTVPQIDFLAKTADILRATWQELGIQVNINMGAPDDIVSQTIKNRDYEALLFGNVLGSDSDLYSFWDSSQRFYPGLNLAIYSNKNVDKTIEDARQNTSSSAIAADLASAQAAIVNDTPAIFLYSPDYVYVTNKNVQGISPGLINDTSDRFREVRAWYLNTARVLK